ncbi:putative Guanosine-diphosphatase [Fasciola hepatica]|uniref:Guanosine-diphosphatase n=1 Tax=Fasciola hepatica TaxID=6192 RepID=A0A4E0RYI7_FASHE|nr:putative Guanosine-diphosphatase [Fasciola hepatica]
MWKILCVVVTINIAAKVACLVAGRMENLNSEAIYASRTRYTVLVDAGSSGSRMFVYTWTTDRDGFANYSSLKLFNDSQGKPLVRKITPGLSSFRGSPLAVRAYISKLLDIAASEIPRSDHAKTPVFVLATAGMRLLPQNEQDIIWNEVRNSIRSKYEFEFKDSYAETITGDEEALFGWIAINFILDSFPSSSNKKKPTQGMLDMGGASMQISYEVSQDQPVPKETTMKFEFVVTELRETLNYKVFPVSYLYYGMQEIRNQYAREVIKTYQQKNVIPDNQSDIQIEDPCINTNLTVTQNVTLNASGNALQLTVDFVGKGDFDLCHNRIVPLLKVRNDCMPLICTINGNARPDVDLSIMQFYGLSEYYYSLDDVMPKDATNYRYDVIAPKVKALCAELWQDFVERLRRENPTLTEEELAERIRLKRLICFKAVYVLATIHEGLQFPKSYDKLYPVTHLRGIETQWTLGALVYILNTDHRKQLQESVITKISIAVVSLCMVLLVIIFIILIIHRERQCKGAGFGSCIERIRLTDKPDGNSTAEPDANNHSTSVSEP